MTTSIASPALSPVPVPAKTLHGVRIKHSRIAQIMNELNTLIYPESQDSILLVCGPTGVGKSMLSRHMVDSALEASAHQMTEDAGLIPAVYVEAPASGESDFSWRLFYQRILAQLGDDMSMPKHEFGIDSHTGRLVRPHGPTGNSLAALRTAVERALRERGTQFLLIDEAAHIIRQTRQNRLEIQLDTLKSLANECGTQIVLVGSYDLYQLVSLSAQLARRIHVIHFERYREDNDADIRAFKACVQKFQDAMPQLWGQQLVQHSAALHENTLGCIGTLSAVLTRAAKLAQADGVWSVDALRRALLTQAQHLQILDEIYDGEAAINPGLTRTMPSFPSAKGRNSERKVA